MERFYLALFGGSVRSRRPGFANFAWGETRLTVTLHEEISGAAVEPARIMINFAVRDVDHMARRAESIGATVVRPPEDESWGGRICTVEDPDGNYLQFLHLP